VVHAASKGHSKVANAVGERHSEKCMQWARGMVAKKGAQGQRSG